MSILYKNIKLRPIERSDLPIIQEWRNEQKLMRYFREYRLFSLDQKESWYDSMIKDNRFEFFIIEGQDVPLGVAGLTYIDWVNRHADVHFYIGKDNLWIDNEFTPQAFDCILDYAFNKLNLNKVWAEIYSIDKLKLDFFKEKGFTVDANLREHYFYNGQYHTSHLLSLLRNEYTQSFDSRSPS